LILGLRILANDVVIEKGLALFDDLINWSNEPILWLKILLETSHNTSLWSPWLTL